MEKRKRLGILTGGGDCPGINAAIRAVVQAASGMGYEIIAVYNGWEGFINGDCDVLAPVKTAGIVERGGTILGTSRLSPLSVEGGTEKVFASFERMGLKALVVVGGDGTLTVTGKLFEKGLPVIGIPKTIDNDIEETDYAVGFHTAVQISTDALDRLRSTAESHHRIMLLEVMGRDTGWIATYAGIAGGADSILIPEFPVRGDEIGDICQMCVEREKRGKNYSLIVVAEGVKLHGRVVTQIYYDKARGKRVTRLGGVGKKLSKIIEDSTGIETRVSSLDYIQRGGTPVAYDRILAVRFGVKAAELIDAGEYGQMVAIKGKDIVGVPLKKMANKKKKVSPEIFEVAKKFFG